MKARADSSKSSNRISCAAKTRGLLARMKIILLCVALLLSSVFLYCMTQYINLNKNANQLTRSILVLADEEETENAVRSYSNKIQAIFPDYLQFFSAHADFQSINESSPEEEICLYCASEASLPETIGGRSIDFASQNEVLVPSSLHINGRIYDGNELLGKEIEILIPIYQNLPDDSGIEQKSVDRALIKVVGVYDSKKNVTQHHNAIFASEDFMEQIYELSNLNQLSESWYIQGRLHQTIIIANDVSAMSEIQTDLEEMGYTTSQCFVWNKGFIKIMLLIAVIMMVTSLAALIAIYFSARKRPHIV